MTILELPSVDLLEKIVNLEMASGMLKNGRHVHYHHKHFLRSNSPISSLNQPKRVHLIASTTEPDVTAAIPDDSLNQGILRAFPVNTGQDERGSVRISEDDDLTFPSLVESSHRSGEEEVNVDSKGPQSIVNDLKTGEIYIAKPYFENEKDPPLTETDLFNEKNPGNFIDLNLKGNENVDRFSLDSDQLLSNQGHDYVTSDDGTFFKENLQDTNAIGIQENINDIKKEKLFVPNRKSPQLPERYHNEDTKETINEDSEGYGGHAGDTTQTIIDSTEGYGEDAGDTTRKINEDTEGYGEDGRIYNMQNDFVEQIPEDNLPSFIDEVKRLDLNEYHVGDGFKAPRYSVFKKFERV